MKGNELAHGRLAFSDLVASNREVLGGVPVFKGTRVPVKSLFDHLEAGDSLDIFLDDFPGVTREQAVGVLELAWSRLAIASEK